MSDKPKTLLQITRAEWIYFHWINVTAVGDNEAVFVRGYERTPDESHQAALDWEIRDDARQKLPRKESKAC